MAPPSLLARAAPLRVLKGLIAWAPVWAPLVLIWQLTEGGLKPALAEEQRLRGEEPAVRARNARTTSEFERLTAQREAWEDPLFLERVRREKARAEAARKAGQAAEPQPGAASADAEDDSVGNLSGTEPSRSAPR